MKSNYSTYLYFRAFVKKWLKDNGKTQNWLALELQVEDGTISKYLGNDFRIAPFEKQLQISDIIEVDYLEILQKGKDIIDGEPIKTIKILSEHQNLVSKFKNPEKAKEINEDLLILESIDLHGYEEVHDIIKMKLKRKTEAIKKRPAANGND